MSSAKHMGSPDGFSPALDSGGSASSVAEPLAGSGRVPSRLAWDRKDRAIAGVVFALMLVAIAAALLVPIETLGYLTNDDAYYYFQPALNIVQGEGVTFDGMNPTNGFHPLWMLISTGLAHAAGADHVLLLRLVYVVLCLLLGGSMILCWAYTRSIAGPIGAGAAILCFAHPLVLQMMLNGLESALLVFLIFLLLWSGRKYGLVDTDATTVKKALLGALLAATFLARLDSAFIVLGIAVAVCLRDRVRVWSLRSVVRLLRSYAPAFGVFVLAVLPYFAWNVSANGHLAPISGGLKSSFPRLAGNWRAVHSMLWLPYTGLIAVTLVLGVTLLLSRGTRRRLLPGGMAVTSSGGTLLAGIWCGLVLHFAYTACFTTWGVKYWTFASHIPVAMVLVALCCGIVADRVERKRVVAAVAFAIILGGSSASHAFVWMEKGNVHAFWHDAAAWVRENTSEDAVFGMTDCGYFGYFSRRTTINLDGLINGYEYQEALADGRLREYFRKCGLDYVVDYEVKDDGRTEHGIRLAYGRQPGARRRYTLFILPTADAIYASPAYQQERVTSPHKPPVRFMIWPYDPNHVP